LDETSFVGGDPFKLCGLILSFINPEEVVGTSEEHNLLEEHDVCTREQGECKQGGVLVFIFGLDILLPLLEADTLTPLLPMGILLPLLMEVEPFGK
jgi:hypothetical protein